jgi:CelD/BcsL family acetyltransferase involved in cellulose biosynthesis
VSFFTSWSWIGCWLRQLPQNVEPLVLRVLDADETIGLAVFCGSVQRRHRFFVSRSLHLHQTGDSDLDAIMIEHNGFVVDRERAHAINRAIIAWLAAERPEWDEICIGGVSSANDANWLKGHQGLWHAVIDQKHGAFVDLNSIRSSGKSYLDHLSSNTRQQVRRSFRWYEQSSGRCEVQLARDRDEALRFYSDLKALHQAYWQSKGEPGAFANPFLDRFHESLIRDRFASGEVQLLHVTSGERTVGCLYNFDFAGRVMNYQSGFRYENDPKCKPGLVCHALAIEHNLALGRGVYDFLAGDDRYKQSLGTHTASFEWHVLQRPRLRFRVENALKAAKRGLQRRMV